MRVTKIEAMADDDLPYAFDFSEWEILTSTEKIVSAVLTATPSGLTIGSATIDATGKIVTVRIAGGEEGTRYRIVLVTTTTSGYNITGPIDFYVLIP